MRLLEIGAGPSIRGFDHDVRDEDYGLDRGGTGTSEIAVRNQFRAWADLMAGTDIAGAADMAVAAE